MAQIQDAQGFLILLLLVVVAWSIWNAVLARRRGRGTIRWFLISLLISPAVITIVLALLGPTRRLRSSMTAADLKNLFREEANQYRRRAEIAADPAIKERLLEMAAHFQAKADDDAAGLPSE